MNNSVKEEAIDNLKNRHDIVLSNLSSKDTKFEIYDDFFPDIWR